ncbi:hypothetical protein SAMN04488577_3117 [Bacillus sp. cl95]|nr:hypothetical protein SAMN02799634_1051 [Bacillus sp. UNCCL13]SFQ87712.1 hypothetical protein SAMN04488577_3117 [Bacillus sp. cl95]
MNCALRLMPVGAEHKGKLLGNTSQAQVFFTCAEGAFAFLILHNGFEPCFHNVSFLLGEAGFLDCLL